ncbi:RBBP9/YdeN family alpha/beta hydrolase [Aerolutibacter daejeonensis]|nr:alpha/beta fold hydrolase [Lysobacter daejeonensis]
MRVVIAHCWTGHPWDGWYPQAKLDLEALGHEVNVPCLPDTDTPDPSAWVSALGCAIGERASETLLVGHSLGALGMLHWLASAAGNTAVRGLFLVAPPLAMTGIVEVDRFLRPAPDLSAVKGKSAQTAVLVSDSDKYLLPSPMTVAQQLAAAIDAQILVSVGKGHFSPASGLRALPELAAWVKANIDP